MPDDCGLSGRASVRQVIPVNARLQRAAGSEGAPGVVALGALYRQLGCSQRQSGHMPTAIDANTLASDKI
jgi:hypothetical protein